MTQHGQGEALGKRIFHWSRIQLRRRWWSKISMDWGLHALSIAKSLQVDELPKELTSLVFPLLFRYENMNSKFYKEVRTSQKLTGNAEQPTSGVTEVISRGKKTSAFWTSANTKLISQVFLLKQQLSVWSWGSSNALLSLRQASKWENLIINDNHNLQSQKLFQNRCIRTILQFFSTAWIIHNTAVQGLPGFRDQDFAPACFLEEVG